MSDEKLERIETRLERIEDSLSDVAVVLEAYVY
jgi:hypothetical protein